MSLCSVRQIILTVSRHSFPSSAHISVLCFPGVGPGQCTTFPSSERHSFIHSFMKDSETTDPRTMTDECAFECYIAALVPLPLHGTQ